MKKTRLLEIIREEIAGALNEVYTNRELKGLNEEQLDEVPDFGGQLDKAVAAKYGKEDTLESATEKITNQVLSDKGITKAEVKNMSPEELKGLLKDIRKFISQKNRTPEVTAALEKQKEIESDRPGGYTGKELQDNQTNKAILRALGFESKKGPKGPTKKKEDEPKAEKEKAEKPKKEKAEKSEPKSKAKAKEEGDEEFEKLEKAEKEFYSSEEEPEQTEKAPVGDKGTEQKARKQDKIIKAYKAIESELKDKIQSAKTGDKEAMSWLKEKQPLIKAYNALKKVEV